MVLSPGLVDSFGAFAFSMADPLNTSQVRAALSYPLAHIFTFFYLSLRRPGSWPGSAERSYAVRPHRTPAASTSHPTRSRKNDTHQPPPRHSQVMTTFSDQDLSIDRTDSMLDRLHHLVADSDTLTSTVLERLVALQIFTTEHEVD
jgi:hypothetical protein